MGISLDTTDEASSPRNSRSRRTFDLSSVPPSPAAITPNNLDATPNSPLSPTTPDEGSENLSHTRSILNLTSSTLYGIYQATGYAPDRDESYTPWGNGAATPIGESPRGTIDLSKRSIPDTVVMNGLNGKVRRRRRSSAQHAFRPPKRGSRALAAFARRALAMFGAGILYGALVSHLHDHRDLAPVKVDGIHHASWKYLIFWGVAGVILGEAFPWADQLWRGDDEEEEVVDISDDEPTRDSRGAGGWNDVLRSVGAFVGIAFAIRKLPWESILQLSLTLAVANPIVWYLIDRSSTGFLLSTIIAIGGTALLLGTNPQLVPAPSPEQFAGSSMNGTFAYKTSDELVFGLFRQESVGVATWIASVLFVSAVCFGNIGRRLAPRG